MSNGLERFLAFAFNFIISASCLSGVYSSHIQNQLYANRHHHLCKLLIPLHNSHDKQSTTTSDCVYDAGSLQGSNHTAHTISDRKLPLIILASKQIETPVLLIKVCGVNSVVMATADWTTGRLPTANTATLHSANYQVWLLGLLN